MSQNDIANKFLHSGFVVIENVYSGKEADALINCIRHTDCSRPRFRKSKDLFAIRQFFKEVPDSIPLVFTEHLKNLILAMSGLDYFVVKSIYFDKPGSSNWFVSYHQDLTISVDRKTYSTDFGPWTAKGDQFAVQPPLSILENNFTIRIHLDDTDEQNGALRVIPGSHQKGIYRPENINWQTEKEVMVPVPKGGIMLMRPLLLHASSRTINNKQRRVLHIEFSNQQLPEPLHWSEYLKP